MSVSLFSARSSWRSFSFLRDPRWSRPRLMLSDLIMLPVIVLLWKHSAGDSKLTLEALLLPLAFAVRPGESAIPLDRIGQNARLALAISLLFILPAVAVVGLSMISFFQAHTTLGALLTWLMLLLTEIPVYRRLPKFSK